MYAIYKGKRYDCSTGFDKKKIDLFSDVDIVGFDFQYGKYVKSVYNADCDRIYYEDKLFLYKEFLCFYEVLPDGRLKIDPLSPSDMSQYGFEGYRENYYKIVNSDEGQFVIRIEDYSVDSSGARQFKSCVDYLLNDDGSKSILHIE